MKGLLIKDWKLLTRQKSTLLIVLGMIFFFPMLGMEPGFTVSYSMIILLFLTVSTISYDDFDNGTAFLLTLPVNRKTYVDEKYVLGIITAIGSWGMSVIINVVYMLLMANESIGAVKEVFLSVLLIFPVTLIMWEAILPMQLKFGAEKARIVSFIVAGVIAAVGVIASKIAEGKEGQINRLMKMLEEIGPMWVGIVLFAVAFAGLLISYVSSVKIVEKKEY